MTSRELSKYLRLHWIKVTLIIVAIAIILSIVIASIIGFNTFIRLDPVFKKSMLSSLPFNIFSYLIVGTVSAAINAGIFVYFVWGGGMTRLGDKTTRLSNVNVKWSDVIGMEGVKKEVWEVIDLMKDRAALKRVGGRIIKGVLMVGPPGCGKTYLAKAIATETKLPFLAAVGSEFIGMFVGTGSAKIRSLYKEARILAEIHGGCLIFIDELDSIARPRTSDLGMGAGMSHNATVNQLLTELDGLRQTENNIVTIAATNVQEYQLDPALMRSGRFDRKIYVHMPGLKDREELFKYYLKQTKFDPKIDASVLAKRALWFSPADIANMVREASLIAVRNKHEQITYKDLSQAYDRVVFGLKSHIILSEKEKVSTAYHESGHAIIAYLTHPTDDIIKATIIPHRGSLGFVARRAQEEIHTQTKEWFLANIKCKLGGYVAEKIRYGTTTAGVRSDFESAMELAHDMVFKYGMGPSGILGNFEALTTEIRSGFFGDYSYGWNYQLSEQTRQKIEKDVQDIFQACIKEVEDILTREKELLDYFAKQLVAKGELEYDEIVEIFKTHGKERPKESYL